MNDLEKQVKDLFEKGPTLAQLRRVAFSHLYDGPTGLDREELTRQRAEATKLILSILGYKDPAEYQKGFFRKRVENEARAKEEASSWMDDEKAQQIVKLFESGVLLAGIRNTVFPKWSADKPQFEKYYNKIKIDQIILKVLECEDWDEYARKQTKHRARRKKEKQKIPLQ